MLFAIVESCQSSVNSERKKINDKIITILILFIMYGNYFVFTSLDMWFFLDLFFCLLFVSRLQCYLCCGMRHSIRLIALVFGSIDNTSSCNNESQTINISEEIHRSGSSSDLELVHPHERDRERERSIENWKALSICLLLLLWLLLLTSSFQHKHIFNFQFICEFNESLHYLFFAFARVWDAVLLMKNSFNGKNQRFVQATDSVYLKSRFWNS